MYRINSVGRSFNFPQSYNCRDIETVISPTNSDARVNPQPFESDVDNKPPATNPEGTDTIMSPLNPSNSINTPESSNPAGTSSQIPNPKESGTPEMQILDDIMYPNAPWDTGCRLLINEVATRNTINQFSFVEHIRLCPKSTRQPKSFALNGFVELVLVSGPAIRQILYSDWTNKALTRVSESSLQKTGPKNVFNVYFVTGSSAEISDSLFSDAHISAEMQQGLPSANDVTHCIVLLYFEKKSRTRMLELDLTKLANTFLSTELSDAQMRLIKKHVQDVFIVGQPCFSDECGFFFDLLAVRDGVMGEGGFLLPIPEVELEQGKPYKSHSRCTNNYFPMQFSSYVVANPTPKVRNECPQIVHKPPFSFQGIPIQSTAQKLIVNAKFFMDKFELDTTLLTGSVVEKTATILGVNSGSVKQAVGNYKSNSIKTPGKRRIRPTPVMDQFDAFRMDHIKRIIQNFYKENRAPTLDLLYNKLISDVREEEEARVQKGETVTVFKCSKWSLRKMIRQLGFRFSTIDKRAVILMRPDIVAKRYPFLLELKRNRESPNPKCVIYTGNQGI